jgi:hypothetical protein
VVRSVALALVLALAMALGVGLGVGGAGAQTPDPPDEGSGSLRPGELVVTQPRLGQLLVITAAGTTRSLSSSLETPRGVVVLDDRSVLVAENTANRISGIEGAFGPRAAPIATFPSPEALAVGADGAVYVSSPTGSCGPPASPCRAVPSTSPRPAPAASCG